MLITHQNFRSIVPAFKTAEAMNNYIGEALLYQHLYYRRTVSGEKSHWHMTKLREFQIDLSRIDRLYRIKRMELLGEFCKYVLVGRMDYNGQAIYFQLVAGFEFLSYKTIREGTIFITQDANMLVNLFFENESKACLDLIIKSLSDDGIKLDDNNSTLINEAKKEYHDLSYLDE